MESRFLIQRLKIEHILFDEVLLKIRGSEVMKVMVVDYTYERRMELIKQDYIEEGIERGRFEQLVELVKDGLIKISDAANRAKMSVEEFELLLK